MTGPDKEQFVLPEEQFDLHQIALEGYVYFYPLVTMEMTRRQMSNSPPGQIPGRGPMNTFVHVRQFPTVESVTWSGRTSTPSTR
jgi:hypothetical protein